MLSRFDIKNYRGFKSYQVDNLAKVNLFVGKNNSGKTALLEGIQLLASGGDPAVLTEAAFRRGELIIGRPDPAPSVDIAHFFHGHSLSSDTSFSLRGDNGYAPVEVKIHSYKSEDTESKKIRQNPRGYALRISGPFEKKGDEHRFQISREGGVDFDIPSRFRRLGPIKRSGGPPVQFVSPDSLSLMEFAAMWDEITITGQEAEVAQSMRVLDSNLDSIHFLMGAFSGGYFPSRGGIVVGMKGQEGRVPLGSMGDGMRRLMAIATSLAFTKQGCLFVDEIDTGLHYSIMPEMWKLIISKAVSAGSQIFATTHSWDCIEGLSLLFQQQPELMSQVAVHKIDSSLAHSVAFSGESIVNMVKSDIDPR